MDIKEIIFVCAWNLLRPELDLQSLLSSMMDWKETELELCKYYPGFLPRLLSSKDYRSEKTGSRRNKWFLPMLTTSRGEHKPPEVGMTAEKQ